MGGRVICGGDLIVACAHDLTVLAAARPNGATLAGVYAALG